MPLFHTAGCVQLTLGPVQRLFTQVLVPGFDPGLVLHLFESAVGVPMSIVFAQTEASPCITQTRLDDSPDDRAETLGRPHPQVEVMIADPDTGLSAPPGVIGEILTRGYP